MRNAWAPVESTAPMNVSLQVNGGFTGKFLGKKIGGSLGISYSKTNRILQLINRSNALSGGVFTENYDFNDTRYAQDISVGALGSFSVQINSLNKQLEILIPHRMLPAVKVLIITGVKISGLLN